MPTESSFQFKKWTVYFDKFGSGPQAILMVPGALGTSRTDFREQIDGPDALDLAKYTLVVVELPGWGRSRPPPRLNKANVYENDIECCYQLMKKLGYTHFAVIGWSDGTKAATGLAIKYQSCVDKVVMWGGPIAFEKWKVIKATSKPADWEPARKAAFDEVYGAATFPIVWQTQLFFVNSEMPILFPEGAAHFKKNLKTIHCPVLVLHGRKDTLLTVEESMEIASQIPDCRFELVASGGHDLHEKCANIFKLIVEDFLDEES